MTTATPDIDPLEVYESVPAISFHAPNGGYAKGVWAKLTVRDWPKLLDQRDDDGNVETWDNGDPKKVLVVPVTNEEGEERNLWAKKMGKKAPQSLYQQLAAAQKKVRADSGDSSYRLGPGDLIAAQYVDDDRSVKPTKGNYPKLYKVVIKPGQRPAPSGDPFADEAAPTAAAAASSDPWAGGDGSSATDPGPAAAPATERPNLGGDPFGDAAPADDEPPF